jgi:hypothetical protein
MVLVLVEVPIGPLVEKLAVQVLFVVSTRVSAAVAAAVNAHGASAAGTSAGVTALMGSTSLHAGTTLAVSVAPGATIASAASLYTIAGHLGSSQLGSPLVGFPGRGSGSQR